MDFLNTIEDNTILIVPNLMKDKILEHFNRMERLIDIKITSFSELKKKLFFDYDETAVLYLMTHYGYRYEVSKTLIENMYYVANHEYSSTKLNHLVKLKKELIAHQLLMNDELFLEYIKDKKVMVYGYHYLDDFQKNMLSMFPCVEVIQNSSLSSSKLVAYEADTMMDEVNFVFSKIAQLLKKGIDIHKIKITNVDSNYYHTLFTISKFYHIPIALQLDNSIISSEICHQFLLALNQSNSLEESIDRFHNLMSIDNCNSKIYRQIINICNLFTGVNSSFEYIKKGIIYHLKNTKPSTTYLQNKVSIVPLQDYIFEKDEYVFLLGFNQGSCPIVIKDEDYISDHLKKEVSLTPSHVINQLNKEAMIHQLYSIHHLVITYKLKSIKEDFYPSILVKELDMTVEKVKLDSISYAMEYSRIQLGNMLDELIKYDIKNDNLDKYYASIKIPYMKYDNQFTGITKQSLLNKLNHKLLLSYSTLDNYYRCSFRYYLANILNLDKYEETFSTLVGNLYHAILSKCEEKDFDLDKEWDLFLQDKNLLVNERFFLVKLKEELKLIVKEVHHLHKETGLTESMLEKKIYIDKSNDVNVTFMGIVDKIMYKNVDGKDFVSIVDYKTGTPNTNLFHTIYGIDMQLPIYLYLVKYSNLFRDVSFVGFYLQKILHGEIVKSNNKSYLEEKLDNLKLIGYSTTDEGKLARFDPTYENSEFIKSMKMTSKGFYTYSKVIEDEKIEAFIDLVDKKIDEAICGILNAKFEINPKQIGIENVGCLYCKFKDICYMREENINHLKEYKDFSFLGGDMNA